MKKYYIILLSFLLLQKVSKAQVTVIFQVDIENYLAEGNVLGSNGMRIGGNFEDLGAFSIDSFHVPNWTPSSAICGMAQIGSSNSWVAIYNFPESSIGQTLLYKFVNTDWGTNEGATTLSDCGIDDGNGGFNRFLIIPNQSIILSYCYDQCTTCNGGSGLLEADNWISGRVFIDSNNNSIFDANEPRASNMNITLTKPSGEITNVYSNVNGYYYASGEDGVNVLTYNSNNQYITSTNEHSVTFTSNPNEVVNHDIPVQLNPNYVDIEAFASSSQVVAGFTTYSQFYVKNNGLLAENLVFNVQIPENFQLAAAFPTGTLNGNTYTWNISSIQTSEIINFTIEFDIPPPPTFMPGDSVVFTGNVTVLPNEANIANNSFNFLEPILSSYDPNDKTMMNGRFLTPTQANSGNPFTFRIRFQNTGNFPAQFIHVRDTLEVGFDASSLKMLSASHEVAMSVENERFIDWYFPNIQLPDSLSDPEGSQGYILFTINPILPLALGDQLENTAHIYFDFNPAVVTNTEITKVMEPLSINKSEIIDIKLIPFYDQLILTGNISTLKSVELINVSGQTLQTWNSNFSELTINNYANGIYLVKCNTERSQKVFKVALVK